MKILGLKRTKPRSKIINKKNSTWKGTSRRNRRKSKINKKIMWGVDLPVNLSKMSYRYYIGRRNRNLFKMSSGLQEKTFRKKI
tara:strand:+ start:491 stop:739 length:249 start_codon:yes stop_codon:yes gene_type:complete